MPKNIHTPRDELICGKLDAARRLAEDHNDAMLAEIIDAIRHDAERMEAKLVSRRDEALTRATSPPLPDDVAEAVERCKAHVIGRKVTGMQKELTAAIETLIHAASTPSAEVMAVQKIPLSASTSGDFIAPDYIKGWNAAIEAITSKSVINKVGEKE